MTSRTDRVLTTHTGSLPRPPELAELMVARETGVADEEALTRLPQMVREATRLVLQRQGRPGSTSAATVSRARSATRRT